MTTNASDEEIDRVLSFEDEILPSSGFAISSWMRFGAKLRRLRQIPFPWIRALPVLVVSGIALALVLVAGIVAVAQLGKSCCSRGFRCPPTLALPPLLHGAMESAAIWTLLALVATFVSVKFSMRLASGRR